MAALIAVGLMNVAAMDVLITVVLLEKTWERGRALRVGLGVAALVLAVAVASSRRWRRGSTRCRTCDRWPGRRRAARDRHVPPSGRSWGAMKSSISMSIRSPARTEWRRPSSTYSMGAVSTPSISPISGTRAAIEPPDPPLKTAPRPAACSGDAAASITIPTRRPPSAITGGASAITITDLSLTSTPSTSPRSTWNTSTKRQRSASAAFVRPHVVQGQTMSQGQFSKHCHKAARP